MEFKVGDKVVYPNHGVGVIEQVAQRSIGEIHKDFYCLRILSTDSTVMVPVDNTRAVGLRKVLTRRQVSQVVKTLKNGDTESDLNVLWPIFARKQTVSSSGEIVERTRRFLIFTDHVKGDKRTLRILGLPIMERIR